MIRYPVVIAGEVGSYGVVFPDMLGVVSMGATVDEALRNAEDVLADVISLSEEYGDAIPSPSALEDIDLEPGEMVAYVTLKTEIAA